MGFVADAVFFGDDQAHFGSGFAGIEAGPGFLESGDLLADGGKDLGALIRAGDDVDFGDEVFRLALAQLDAGPGSAERGFIDIASAGSGFPVPEDLEFHMGSAEGVIDGVVADVVEFSVVHGGCEGGGECGFSGDLLELGLGEGEWPVTAGEDLDVLMVIEGGIGEGGPLDEVDDVGADVGEGFSILGGVEEPDGAAEGESADDFHDVMNAFRVDGGRGGGTFLEGSEDGGRVEEGTLEQGGDFVAFRHDVVADEAFGGGEVESLFEFGEIGEGDDPGLVGEDMQSGLERGEDAIDLAAVAAGEDDSIAGMIMEHGCHGVRAGVDIEVPVGGVVLAVIEEGDAVEVVEQFRAEAGIDGDARIEGGVHFALNEGGMEVARIDDDEPESGGEGLGCHKENEKTEQAIGHRVYGQGLRAPRGGRRS